MALDERRLLFPLTRLVGPGNPAGTRLLDIWFRGVHSDVGGGNGNAGLNWISLNWMFENARREGLPLSPTSITANLAHRAAPQQISITSWRSVRRAAFSRWISFTPASASSPVCQTGRTTIPRSDWPASTTQARLRAPSPSEKP